MGHAKANHDGEVEQRRPAGPELTNEMGPGYPNLPGVAHELGNLLTVVSSWVQRWEQAGPSTPEAGLAIRGVDTGLRQIRYGLNRLASSVAHPNSHLTVVDLNSVLRHVLSHIGPGVENGHTVTGIAEPDPWPVIGDFWALDFVLANLVMDAVVVSPPGSPIFVKTSNVEADTPVHGIGGSLAEGAYVSLSVHHFEDKAGQASARIHTQQSLPLCLRILEEHGGLLQGTQSPHGESRAVMFLPAVARCLPAEHAGDAPAEACP